VELRLTRERAHKASEALIQLAKRSSISSAAKVFKEPKYYIPTYRRVGISVHWIIESSRDIFSKEKDKDSPSEPA
jgi:hypothetical protein